jgi:radical SAM protein with 4Fe4S-binding SPASM domain
MRTDLAHWIQDLRDPSKLKGPCHDCEFRDVCGGQRGRAYGITGDWLESDPACILVKGGRLIRVDGR